MCLYRDAPTIYRSPKCRKNEGQSQVFGFPKDEQRRSEWIRAHINGELIPNNAVV